MANIDHARITKEILQSLDKAGVQQGDIVYFHVSIEKLNLFEDHGDAGQASKALFEALSKAVGPRGTMLIPTYSFSFCRREEFDVENTPAERGPWSESLEFVEYFRKQPGVVRSRDPIHSVAGLGPKASELLDEVPNTCFGPDCVHDRLRRAGGKICMIGLGLDEATFRHHVEEVCEVPTRFKKLFTGYIREKGAARKEGWVYNVRIMADNCYPSAEWLEDLALRNGTGKAARLGSGQVLVVNAAEYFDLVEKELNRDPWCTVKGPKCDTIQLEKERVGTKSYQVSLPLNASIQELIDHLWHLPRDIVSDGFDAALEALATQLPVDIQNYPTGTECWSWIVPEKWACHEAYLETLDGTRLFSYDDNPLHVVSYSLPFEGQVSREELLKHLYTHPRIPEAIPFIFKYYERDWGLCCSRNLKESLKDPFYKVVIRTSFSYSNLKVGEVVVPGSSDESIMICVHLCHPHQVNDDLSGVIVGVKAFQELLKRPTPRYTYRLMIVPETIGSIAYLSKRDDLIPKMKGGLYLEMLGTDLPHALQMSFEGDSELDRCFALALKERDSQGWTGAYRTVIGNDERQFNGPGVRVPMLSLARVYPESAPNWPYREYHSSFDNPSLVSAERLQQSVDMVLKMVDVVENNLVPVNNFKGEVFCSRFGVFIDPDLNPEGNRALFNIMDHIDGTRSVAQIAAACKISFNAVKDTVSELARHHLVEYTSANGRH